MISASSLNIGRHGSTHSLQQIHSSAARNLQQHPSSPDSPQLQHRRNHETITEGEECSDDDKTATAADNAVKSSNDPAEQSEQKHKKGSLTSHKDRR